jgi:hypothetical protein
VDRRAGFGALALAILLVPALGAGAQPTQSLAISPPSLDLTDPPLFPGEMRIAHMTIFNSGDQEFDVTAQGAEPAGTWITPDPASFHLALHGKQDVTLRIDVPADAATGHHLGRIDFNPVPGDPGSGSSQIISGVSGLLDITVDPTATHDLAIEAMGASNVHRGEALPVEVRARNNGNVADAYHLELVVLDADRSNLLLRTSFDSAPLTAGDNRTDTFNVPLTLAEGQYAYNLTATQKGTTTVLRTEEGLFQVAAPGAAFKLGAMPFISVAPKQVQPGQEVHLTVLFRNEGAPAVGAAKFVGSVLRDGAVVDSLESPVAKVGPHGNATLLAAYVPQHAGTYLIRGHVLYDGLRTEEGESGFEVGAAKGFLAFLPGISVPHVPVWLATPVGLLLALIGLLGLLGLWRRRRRERKPERKKAPAPGKPTPAAEPSALFPAWLQARAGALVPPPKPSKSSWWRWFSFRPGAAAPEPSSALATPRQAEATEAAQQEKTTLSWRARAAAWLRRATQVFHRKAAPVGGRPSNASSKKTSYSFAVDLKR